MSFEKTKRQIVSAMIHTTALMRVMMTARMMARGQIPAHVTPRAAAPESLTKNSKRHRWAVCSCHRRSLGARPTR